MEMKKIVLLLFLITLQINAQEIGLKLGNFANNNISIDGTLNFNDATRLHGDITFGNGVETNLVYDFKIHKLEIQNSKLQYYIGTGIHTYLSNEFLLGINGEAGIEYLFKQTPITIGIDWRPQLNIITKTSIDIFEFGFNIRYRINEL